MRGYFLCDGCKIGKGCGKGFCQQLFVAAFIDDLYDVVCVDGEGEIFDIERAVDRVRRAVDDDGCDPVILPESQFFRQRSGVDGSDHNIFRYIAVAARGIIDVF